MADRWLDGDMDRTTELLCSYATHLSFDHLSPEVVHQVKRTLIARMAIQANEDSTRRHPGEFNCRIEISDRSGNVFAAQTACPKGHRSNPLTDSEVEGKFRGLASGVLTQGQCGRALEIAWSLDGLSSLEELFCSLVV